MEFRGAVLDSERVADIRGALGTIGLDDTGPRCGRSAHLKTLLAVIGPGQIVMVGDNDGRRVRHPRPGRPGLRHPAAVDAAALVPVLYVKSGGGAAARRGDRGRHARLILERLGKVWGAFSVIGLFLLTALTLITEFIASPGRLVPGRAKIAAVALAAAVVVGAAFTGSFRRFERITVAFCAGGLLLIPVYFLSHPAPGRWPATSSSSGCGRHRPAIHRHAADHRRRHHGRPVAAVLPAEFIRCEVMLDGPGPARWRVR